MQPATVTTTFTLSSRVSFFCFVHTAEVRNKVISQKSPAQTWPLCDLAPGCLCLPFFAPGSVAGDDVRGQMLVVHGHHRHPQKRHTTKALEPRWRQMSRQTFNAAFITAQHVNYRCAVSWPMPRNVKYIADSLPWRRCLASRSHTIQIQCPSLQWQEFVTTVTRNPPDFFLIYILLYCTSPSHKPTPIDWFTFCSYSSADTSSYNTEKIPFSLFRRHVQQVFISC